MRSYLPSDTLAFLMELSVAALADDLEEAARRLGASRRRRWSQPHIDDRRRTRRFKPHSNPQRGRPWRV
jgi:hypothetical protein